MPRQGLDDATVSRRGVDATPCCWQHDHGAALDALARLTNRGGDRGGDQVALRWFGGITLAGRVGRFAEAPERLKQA